MKFGSEITIPNFIWIALFRWYSCHIISETERKGKRYPPLKTFMNAFKKDLTGGKDLCII